MALDKKTAVVTPKAPAAIGPYSQGIAVGDSVYVSGQTPLRADGTLVTGSITDQTTQCINNVEAVLGAAELGLEHVVKCTVYMTDLGKFAEMNEVYSKRFHAPFPARATVQVSALPKGAAVEIDAVAVRP